MIKFGLIGGGGVSRPINYILNPPSNFSGVGTFDPAGGDDGTVTLTWTDTAGNTEATDSYLIYKDDAFLASVDAPTLTYADTDGIDADTAYRYTIRTKDVNGFNSEHSSSLSVPIPNLILPATPNAPTLSPRGIDSLTLNWVEPTIGSYPIEEYIVKQEGVEVTRTVNLNAVVYFEARKRLNPKWTIIAIDTQGWQSSESASVVDTSDGNIDPLSDAIEWNYHGSSNPENTRVFLGAILQNETANVNDYYTFGGLDNQYDGVALGDVEFTFRSELLSNKCHSFPLAIKMTDESNWISMRIWGGETQVYERIGGVDAKLFSQPHSGNKNETFTIKSVGQEITCWRYDTKIFTYTTTLTGTQVGIVQRSCPSGNNYLGSYYKLVTTTCLAEGTQLFDNSNFDCGTDNWHSDPTYPATITDNGDGTIHLDGDTEYGSIIPDNDSFPDGSYTITVNATDIVGVGKVSIRDGGGTWHSQTLLDGVNEYLYTGVIDTVNIGADNDVTFECNFDFVGLEIDTTVTFNGEPVTFNGEVVTWS